MDGEAIIDINVPNIITICVMAFLGFAVLGIAAKAIAKARAGRANA